MQMVKELNNYTIK